MPLFHTNLFKVCTFKIKVSIYIHMYRSYAQILFGDLYICFEYDATFGLTDSNNLFVLVTLGSLSKVLIANTFKIPSSPLRMTYVTARIDYDT